MPVRPVSGSDVDPVSYPSVIAATIYFWEDPDYIPEYRVVSRAVPTYAPLMVYGPNIEYLQQLRTYGGINIRITQSNINNGGLGAFQTDPPFISVTINSVRYKMQVGVTVPSVPRIVYDALNNSGGSYAAVIV